MKIQVSQILSPVWKANEQRPKSRRVVTRDEKVKARLGKGTLNAINPCCVRAWKYHAEISQYGQYDIVIKTKLFQQKIK